MRSVGMGYLLWLACVVGFCGIHRFYAGKMVTGIVWLLTFGLLGIGQIVDLFLIPSMIRDANARLGHSEASGLAPRGSGEDLNLG